MISLRKLPKSLEIPKWGEFELFTINELLFKSFCYRGKWESDSSAVELCIHPPKKSMKRWDEFLEPVPQRIDTILAGVNYIITTGWEVIEPTLDSWLGDPVPGVDTVLASLSPSLVRIAVGEDDELYLRGDVLGCYSLDLTLGADLDVLDAAIR